MLLPGTFLGVWSLISISGHRGAAISASWIQAHGHAQIFGWIGTFILGIGFYSIPKKANRTAQPASHGWVAWALWTTGVLMRWAAGFYHLYWRLLFPVSAMLELCAFLIFLQSVKGHRPAKSTHSTGHKPVWMIAVLVGTAGFGAGLLMNLLTVLCVSVRNTGPEFPAATESRFLTLLAYGFIVPTVWGFSARWLPVFLGLKLVDDSRLGYALLLNITGIVLTLVGLSHIAAWVIGFSAIIAFTSFHLFGETERPAKVAGVHHSFPAFGQDCLCLALNRDCFGRLCRIFRSCARLGRRVAPRAYGWLCRNHGVCRWTESSACLCRNASLIQSSVDA
jgi:uncharacterized protein involved in response to NO